VGRCQVWRRRGAPASAHASSSARRARRLAIAPRERTRVDRRCGRAFTAPVGGSRVLGSRSGGAFR
jgi:hypothetical protein